ncbi:unnamed protein product, partial [marine sediment metagenome]
MNRILVATITVALIACAQACLAQVEVAQDGPSRITLTCALLQAQGAQAGPAARRATLPVELPGAAPRWEIGKPQVPVYRVCLAVPHGAVVTLSTSMTSERLVPAGREIEPMQPQPPTTGRRGNVRRLVKDRALYASSAPYPAERARIVNRGFVRDVEVITVEIAPLQYVPKTRMLRVADGLEVVVSCDGGERLLTRRIEAHQLGMYRALVDNVAAIEAEDAALEAEAAGAGAPSPTPEASPDTGA